MKKLLAIVISMAMLVAMMPMGVFADGETSGDGSSGGTPVTEKVAKIGDREYETLEAAVEAAGTGDTITLVNNVELTATVLIDKDLTIDLNGHNISSIDARAIHIKGGNVSFENASETESVIQANKSDSGTFADNSSVIRIGDNDGAERNTTLVIGENVAIKSSHCYGVGVFGNKTKEKVIINGEVNVTGTAAALSGNGSTGYGATEIIINKDAEIIAEQNAAIYHPQSGTLTINGGKIIGTTGIECKAGETTVVVNGNPIITATAEATHNANGDGTSTKGYAIAVVENKAYAGNPAVTINSGNYTGPIAILKDNEVNNDKKGHITITGGTFNDVSAASYFADNANVTIKLNEDKNMKGLFLGHDKNINLTVDLNGKTWTTGTPLVGSPGYETQAFHLEKNNTVTIKNGTITSKADAKCKMLLQNYSDLTLENVTLNGKNLEGENRYVSSNNNGTVKIIGSTSILAKDGDFAFDAYYWPDNGYTTPPTVVINTTGEIDGKVEITRDDSNKNENQGAIVNIISGIFKKSIEKKADKATLSITGGTFSTDPKDYVADGYVVRGSNPYVVEKYIPYTPSTPSTPAVDNVTNNPADKNTTADLAPAVKDNKAETTVDAKTADKIVDKAVENKSTEVIVDATGNNSVASSEVAIPEKTVKELAEKTDAKLVIKTDNGKVDLDKTALAAVAAQAGTDGTVKLVVETVKTDADICHVNLKLVTSNGAVTDFKGGNVAVTINLTKELAAKDVVCVYINDNGIYTLVNGQKNADGTYTFTTGHFSEYAVMAKAEADKKIAEQLDTMIKDVNLKVRTSKTAKKNIKAVVSGDVKAITDAGYTVKYKFYRSEKKASKYVGKVTKDTKTYINTAGKKGTKYYYKAKALVYDGDKLVGQTVLTQCKYGVRTWSK